MTRIARSRRVWRGALIGAAALALLGAPGMAAASYDDCGRDHRGAHVAHGGRHHAHPGRHLGHHKAHKHAKHYAQPYCASCNRYFGARDELYAHVEYAHRVPYGDQGLAISVSWFGSLFAD